MTQRKKLIEVALPLEAINVASAREKSIRHGHPSTLHLWWARRPLAAARAVIFTSLVDDPDSEHAPKAFVEACKKLPKGNNAKADDTPRMRLFDFIERLVTWEATTDEAILEQARELILLSTDGNPPPLLDPFAGGGSIPLEAQRLGLEAHASDLNPVAVMINKAQIEIPPRFADMPPVNPRDREKMFGTNPHPKSLPRNEGGTLLPQDADVDKWDISPQLEHKMQAIARNLRNNPTEAEDTLWQAIRKKQLDGRKFRRQVAIGAFVVDFYCSSERLAVEVDGPIHDTQQEADQIRQELIESLGIRFVRLTNDEIERDLKKSLEKIRAAFISPSLPVGEGAGGWGDTTWKGAAGLAADVRYYGEWMRDKAYEKIGHLYPEMNGETVIAWLWARTVKSPNPAVNAHVPLVRSFILSKKKGRECWAKPIIDGQTICFEVTPGKPPKGENGTVSRSGGMCIISGQPMPFDYIREEAKAGRMGAMLMAIVTEGDRQRNYYSPTDEQTATAESVQPAWKPMGDIPEQALGFRVQLYGMDEYNKLFTSRQLVALSTFSDLVHEARDHVYQDALAAGLPDDDTPLRDGGCGAMAYAEAVSVYLGMCVSKVSNYWSNLCSRHSGRSTITSTFGRQALPMVWDYTEANPFSESTGNFLGQLDYAMKVVETSPQNPKNGFAIQKDATQLKLDARTLSTDPPYYDMIGYADLSDFFYVWMRPNLKTVYPDVFSTMLVPKEPELIASPYRHGGNEQAEAHFENGMFATFQNIRRFVMPEYPLTVYYAFKQQDAEVVETGADIASTGWETMLSSLIDSGFSVDGTWPVRTEYTGNLKKNVNSLASSIVLVCRPRAEDAPQISRREFVSLLRQELPPALIEMQSGNIAPVDLAQASIGPGMAVYSRFSQVLEAGGTPLTVRTALQIINQELDAYLSEAEVMSMLIRALLCLGLSKMASRKAISVRQMCWHAPKILVSQASRTRTLSRVVAARCACSPCMNSTR